METLFINGFRVVINNYLGQITETKQFKFPKTKKLRLKKKWRKNIKNYKTEIKDRMVFDKENQVFYCSKENFDLIKSFEKILNYDHNNHWANLKSDLANIGSIGNFSLIAKHKPLNPIQ